MNATPQSVQSVSPAAQSEPTPVLLKLPKSEFTGSILGLAVLLAVNFLWFSHNPGFEGVCPHPFWLVVLPMAARYGFRAGAVAGLLSALVLLGLRKLGHPDTSWQTVLALSGLIQPLLFVAGGILLGEIREAQKTRYETLAAEHRQLTENHEDLVQRYEALSRAKQELDTHIISQEQTLTTIYEAAKGLKSLQEEEIFPAVVEILVTFLSAESCAVYLLVEGRLVLAASREPKEDFVRHKEIPVDEGMAAEAIVTRRTVSLNALTPSADFAKLADDGIVICVPLFTSDNQVLGVLTIERLPFLKFNPQAVRLASIIGEWCGSAIENARSYKDIRDKNIADDVTGAYTYKYFVKRLNEEFQRARRYGQELSLIVFNIDDFASIEGGFQKDILTVLSLIFKNRLRGIDLYFHDQEESRYFIVLPSTPLEGAKVASRKIFSEILAFKFRPFGDERTMSIRTGIATVKERMKRPEELIEEAIRAIKEIQH